MRKSQRGAIILLTAGLLVASVLGLSLIVTDFYFFQGYTFQMEKARDHAEAAIDKIVKSASLEDSAKEIQLSKDHFKAAVDYVEKFGINEECHNKDISKWLTGVYALRDQMYWVGKEYRLEPYTKILDPIEQGTKDIEVTTDLQNFIFGLQYYHNGTLEIYTPNFVVWHVHETAFTILAALSTLLFLLSAKTWPRKQK